MIRGVVFDVDDTLYLERDYVRSGFDQVAARLAGDDAERARIGHWLRDAFDRGVRGDTFDLLLAAMPELTSRASVGDLVAAYRGHAPVLAFLPGIPDVLEACRRDGRRLGVLSDGPLESQAAKAAALGLEAWFDPVVLTARDASFAKPGRAGFASIAAAWGLDGPELVYVADNPLKDFVAPRALGWRTIRLRVPGQLRFDLEAPDAAHAPDVEVDDAAHVLAHLG